MTSQGCNAGGEERRGEETTFACCCPPACLLLQRPPPVCGDDDEQEVQNCLQTPASSLFLSLFPSSARHAQPHAVPRLSPPTMDDGLGRARIMNLYRH